MKNHLAQIKSLTQQETSTLFTACLLLPIIAIILQLYGLKRTQGMLTQFTKTSSEINLTKSQQQQIANMIARMVFIASNHGLYRANCLKKSLVIILLLKRRGIDAHLRIGAQKIKGCFNAHAWVELNDCALIENQKTIQRYQILV